MKCPQCGHISVTRSLSQNELYWKAYVEPIAEAAGCTPLEIHASLRDEILGRVICKSTLKGFVFEKIGGSTTGLTTKEFSDYLEKVAQIAAETYGVVIQ